MTPEQIAMVASILIIFLVVLKDARKSEAKRKKENEIRKNNLVKTVPTIVPLSRPSFNYSEVELKFRKDIDLIDDRLHFSGRFSPVDSDEHYEDIYQGCGIMDGGNPYDIINEVHPWVKVYEAFFDNKSFDYDKLSVVSDGVNTQMMLGGIVIATKEVVGDFDGVIDIITLSDCGHKDFETMFYLNRIIAAYGHNTIVDDARVNPRYGRVDIDKVIHHAERYIPWRIKNAFNKGDDIEMIDWTGGARIEVEIWKDHYNPDDEPSLCIKTTFYINGTDQPIGTMSSNDYFSVEDFNYFYKK
jgi:hypothetical protein